MTREIRLGKIRSATFGQGGYQNGMFGFWLTFASDEQDWETGTGSSVWDYHIDAEGTKWTEEERTSKLAKVCRTLSETLRAAKVEHVAQLVGKPVEVVFDRGSCVSWRILTEVL
jgi:hypothetical protein